MKGIFSHFVKVVECVSGLGRYALVYLCPEPVHGHQRRRPAIDQKARVFGIHHEARVETPAGPEGVAGTQKLDFHGPLLFLLAVTVPFSINFILESDSV